MESNYTCKPWRRRGEARKIIFVVLLLVYVGFISLSLVMKNEHLKSVYTDKQERLLTGRESRGQSRVRRETHLYDEEAEDDDEAENKTKTCTPSAIDEFPANFFTKQETMDGGIAVHVLLALYMFGTLAIVCDDYFVPSLEVISFRLDLQEDVAGATFMAAGSSAPEFFTSVIGVFIAKSDVGVGTIVGSAVFNILFIIGLCAIFAGMIVKLTWYPMTRDCVFYLISIAALVIALNDELIYWYEATIFVVLYIVYILMMYFNRSLENKAVKLLSKVRKKFFKPHTGENTEADEKQPLSENTPSGTYTESSVGKTETSDIETVLSDNLGKSNSGAFKEDKLDSPWDYPENKLLQIFWITMLPVKALMYVSIPDVRRPGLLRRLYPVSFVMSIAWIAASSYLMVWMVIIIGDALSIPDTVMGLTILAAGTSVPDCLSSIFVARDGLGDMAVSNSIGSNVFDILMCLGLPWLLDTTIVKKGDPLVINSGGITYSAIILLSTVAFLLLAINLAKWKLTKPFGCLCLVAYVAVISVSCLFELNVFGDFVDPTCKNE